MPINYSTQIETIQYVVQADEGLSEQKRKWLTKLYQPFIGGKATLLYQTLYDTIPPLEIESELQEHYKLLTQLKIKNMQVLVETRQKLEACGILETYRNNSITIYVLKPVLKPAEFFDDLILSQMLKNNIGISEFENLQRDFLVTRYDYNQLRNVTKAFDEVYDSIYLEASNENEKWWNKLKKSRPQLKKEHIEMETIIAKIEPRNIYKREVLYSRSFQDTINAVAFTFGLGSDKIVEALNRSFTNNGELDEKVFIKSVKKLYDSKSSTGEVKIEPKKTKKELDEALEQVETVDYSSFVYQKYHKPLLSSELEVLYTLQHKHGFSHGFVFALMVYVMDNTNGSFPALNYFLKIATDWYRRGIRTTADALEYLSDTENEKYKRTSPKTYQNKTKKEVKSPDWVDDYIKEIKNKKDDEEDDEEISLSELEEFFNKKQRWK